ncbi:MAG: 16S rRNA processing protein RimM [Chloroflexi bacterium]|jgi:16S rRNA processing protein RimM|nr:16S rRNA processing protein RimM [Chloroflexota bacterium]MBT4073763.1 16S rRNA processing protein RimM [Chloroflexota bacterium]MBT4514080.1 16S rRNA processing protein RimM [Chloroflexota bacterium]MBT6683197.1 16S rRNA processing protein RimM [Chloroflexota bacterium]
MSPQQSNRRRRRQTFEPGQVPRKRPPASEKIQTSTPTRVGVASVRRSWGVDGSIAVSQFSEDEDRFSPGVTVYINGGREARILDSHRAGSAIVLQLDIVRNTRDANALRGTVIEMEGDDIPEAPDGTYYHYEIVGAKVRTTEGEELGEVLEIIVTGANDVYVVGDPKATDAKGQILIPAIADVVLEVDVNNGIVTVNLPEGLR